MSGFELKRGFPQVGGAIDGTHIPIIAPPDFPVDFYNRKGFHNMNMQAVVDYKYSASKMVLLMSLGVGLVVGCLVYAYVMGTEHVITRHRWVLVCFGLIPLSLIYGTILRVRNYVIFKMNSAPTMHDRKVQQICQQIKDWRASGGKQKLCTGRAGWESMSLRAGRYKDTFKKIQMPLYDVLEIDTKRRVVRAEPMVTMNQLLSTLYPMGWTLPIVPELDDLTVGGMTNGSGIEATSHKCGLWQHICEAYEVVLPDGEVKRCTKDENADIFYSIPWSCGTIGFVTAVEIQIIPAKKYIRLEYFVANTRQDMVRLFGEHVRREEGNEFVEGIVFSDNQAVVMAGYQTDSVEPDKVNNIGNFYKPWFYTHVESKLGSGGAQHVEYIPLHQYYFRHSKGIFWEMKDILPFGNNVVFRHLFGWAVPPRISLMKRTQTAALQKLYTEKHMVQDVFVPFGELEAVLELLHQVAEIYPLWMCPFTLRDEPGLCHAPSDGDNLYVDVGVYGVPKSPEWHYLDSVKKVEQFQRDCRGFQMSYADTHQTKEQFREMFDHSLYDKVRRELGCEDAFPEVYNKISQAARR